MSPPSAPPTSSANLKADLHLAFDIGHSSIGWAVLQAAATQDKPQLLGCGSVIFPADDCLANKRRDYRRQRRHIRATRQRIERMAILVHHLLKDSASEEERAFAVTLHRLYIEQRPENRSAAEIMSTAADPRFRPHPAPWVLAARILSEPGKLKLTWPILWSILRWYAHNRGYDGNKRWAGGSSTESLELATDANPTEAAALKDDTEKVVEARRLMAEHGTETMAQTLVAVAGLASPLDKRMSTLTRIRGLNAAFPREVVEHEVGKILAAAEQQLPACDHRFINALYADPRTIPCPGLAQIPKRFQGGILFGQSVPRFANRIIAICPFTYQREIKRRTDLGEDLPTAKHHAERIAKVPNKDTPEFFRFRWAMQVANTLIRNGPRSSDTRPLSLEERAKLDAKMSETGRMTPGQLKKAVRELTGTDKDNLDQLLSHEDAGKALETDRLKTLLTTHEHLAAVYPLLPVPLQKRLRGKLGKGKEIRLRDYLGQDGTEAAAEALRAKLFAPPAAKKAARKKADDEAPAATKKAKDAPRSPEQALEEALKNPIRLDPVSGRAPYSRVMMREAIADVFERGIHPSEQGGTLYRDDAILQAQLTRTVTEQTNNHLVRHRLTLLEKLHSDILAQYAGHDIHRIARVALEVNRDLRDFSGLTAKEITSEVSARLANFKSAADKVTDLLAKSERFQGTKPHNFASLVRKVRIAMDLADNAKSMSSRCPYTGRSYDLVSVIHGSMTLDHVVPHSQRQTNALDALVVTFPEVNAEKGNRTGLEFIRWMNQPEQKHRRDALGIVTEAQYKTFVEKLDTKGHDQDRSRKRRRKENLLLESYVEKTFTPRDLTTTSQITRLSAQVLERQYITIPRSERPVFTSIPGSVTGFVRKSWSLVGTLALANPAILAEDGQPRPKGELRSITHLHHALDACTLAFTDHFLPRNGQLWELMSKRNHSDTEKLQLRELSKGLIIPGTEGRTGLQDLPTALKDQIARRLAERRVVQHIPAEYIALSAEETVYRVYSPDDPHPTARRIGKWLAKANVRVPKPCEESVLIVTRKRREGPEKASDKPLHQTQAWRWFCKPVLKTKLMGLMPEGGTGKLSQIKAAKVIGDNYGAVLDPQPEVIRAFRVWNEMERQRAANQGQRPRLIRNGMIIRVPHGNFMGTWRVLSVKDDKTKGVLFDLGAPDEMSVSTRDVRLKTLLRDGLEILPRTLIGVAAPRL